MTLRAVSRPLAVSLCATLLAAGGCSSEPEEPPPETEMPLEVIDRSEESPNSNPLLDTVETPLPEGEAFDFAHLIDLQQEAVRNDCECNYAELGHDSAEDCYALRRLPEFARTCRVTSFLLYEDELTPRYACLARVREESLSCFEQEGCAGRTECISVRDEGRSQCGTALTRPDADFAESYYACQARDRLGTPSGCPDQTVPERLLGERVFEGITTGAGDDVTLSCSWDFDNAASADVTLAWRAPEAGTYVFDTRNSNFVSQIGILEGCGGAELACSSPSGDYGEAATVATLEQGQEVLIVVEGYHVAETGYYAVGINAL